MGEYLSAYHLGICVFWSVFTDATFASKNFSTNSIFGTSYGICAFAFLDQSRQTPL